MKATDRIRTADRGQFVTIRIERTDLRAWFAEPLPVILIVYDAANDRAYWLHVQAAFVGLTARTATLFGPPGDAYVYRSYGIHALLNAVCEPEGVGAAVLIRALEPVRGVGRMEARRRLKRREDLCSGPGKLTQALGIELHHNGGNLAQGPVRIAARQADWEAVDVVVDRRIGITKAVELPWRFCAAGSRYLSRPAGERLSADASAAGAATAGTSAAGTRA